MPVHEHATFVARLSEAEVIELITALGTRDQLSASLGPQPQVRALSAHGNVFEVTAGGERYVVRLARDQAHLASLRREAQVGARLAPHVSLRVPDTHVIAAPCSPAWAIHTMIPGKPLTTDHYRRSGAGARARLTMDLARFFRETHRITLERACDWLGLSCQGPDIAAELAPALGKPLWFGPAGVDEIRRQLAPLLEEGSARILEHTIARFRALPADARYMVFGHGDMHGYNIALKADKSGPRVVGVFDLECTGILDIHEDFFRLSLVSEEMLDQVLSTYQNLGAERVLDRDRIAVYYRAFLFYLMVGKTGEGLNHLYRLLSEHVTYYRERHGGLH
jgi:aminoglycoside phosphotransferase (APT) family kinase protein